MLKIYEQNEKRSCEASLTSGTATMTLRDLRAISKFPTKQSSTVLVSGKQLWNDTCSVAKNHKKLKGTGHDLESAADFTNWKAKIILAPSHSNQILNLFLQA